MGHSRHDTIQHRSAITGGLSGRQSSRQSSVGDGAFADDDHVDIDHALRGGVRVSDWVRAAVRHYGLDQRPPAVHIHPDGRITRVSDAEAEFDAVERTLLALTRLGIVTQSQLSALHGAYLRQSSRD